MRVHPAPKRFRAAIFDLDGVIVGSEGAQRLTFNEIFANFGIKVGKSYWARHYTAVGARAVIKDVFRRYGIRESVEEWVEKRAIIYQHHIRKHGLPEVAGFGQFYRLLKKSGIKIGIASGSQRAIIAASLDSIGHAGIPYAGIEDVEKGKPAPDLFLLAAKKLRAAPSECVVFEDAPAGIEAASRAGMACVALATTNSATSLKGKAALVVKDFSSPALAGMVLRLISARKH